MLMHMIFTLFTFKNDQNEEMRKLMPTCSNIIHPIIHFRFPVTWKRKSLESAENSISERLNIKIFSGSMSLDPPTGAGPGFFQRGGCKSKSSSQTSQGQRNGGGGSWRVMFEYVDFRHFDFSGINLSNLRHYC